MLVNSKEQMAPWV